MQYRASVWYWAGIWYEQAHGMGHMYDMGQGCGVE